MRARYLALAAVGVLALLATPSLAQEDAVFTEVEPGDDDANKALGTADGLALVFVNFDADNRVDPVDPAEPVYISMSFTGGVNFGDIRLTGFLTYPPGSVVNYTNRDTGLQAKEIPGWFALGPDDGWYIDTDDDGTVSVGDLRLHVGGAAEGVRAGDQDVGASLQDVQADVQSGDRILYEDRGASGVGWEDTFYLDVDGNGQVNPGELRFEGTRLGIDDAVTARDLTAAVERLEGTDSQLRDDDQRMESRMDTLRADLSTWDKWLLALGLVNLVAVAGLGYWVVQGHGRHAHDGDAEE